MTHQKFYDDFALPELDASKWHTGYWWLSPLLPCYDDCWYNDKDCSIESSPQKLVLTTRLNPRIFDNVMYPYSVGQVYTNPIFTVPFAIEVSCKLPCEGHWSAAWLYSEAPKREQTEIDFMEQIKGLVTEYFTNLHSVYKKCLFSRTRRHQKGQNIYPADWNMPDTLDSKICTYGVEVEKESITFYFEGRAVRIIKSRKALKNAFGPYRLILTNAPRNHTQLNGGRFEIYQVKQL